MATIAEMVRRFSQLDVRDESIKILEETKSELINANTEKQLLEKGIDKNGYKLPDYKPGPYKQKKLLLNPRGVRDLKLTGEFHSGWYLSIDRAAFTFVMGSNDPDTDKVGRIEKREGTDTYGVTNDNLAAYTRDTFKPRLFQRITDITGLKVG